MPIDLKPRDAKWGVNQQPPSICQDAAIALCKQPPALGDLVRDGYNREHLFTPSSTRGLITVTADIHTPPKKSLKRPKRVSPLPCSPLAGPKIIPEKRRRKVAQEAISPATIDLILDAVRTPSISVHGGGAPAPEQPVETVTVQPDGTIQHETGVEQPNLGIVSPVTSDALTILTPVNPEIGEEIRTGLCCHCCTECVGRLAELSNRVDVNYKIIRNQSKQRALGDKTIRRMLHNNGIVVGANTQGIKKQAARSVFDAKTIQAKFCVNDMAMQCTAMAIKALTTQLTLLIDTVEKATRV